MSDAFNYLPCAWLYAVGRDRRLSERCLRLAVIIAQRIDPADGLARLSHADLARAMRASEAVVLRARDRLCERGYITHVSGHGGKKSMYWLAISERDDARIDPRAFYGAFPLGGVQ